MKKEGGSEMENSCVVGSLFVPPSSYHNIINIICSR
jgi:hypothetical protein